MADFLYSAAMWHSVTRLGRNVHYPICIVFTELRDAMESASGLFDSALLKLFDCNGKGVFLYPLKKSIREAALGR
jgi:hypothetical protein